MSRAKRNERMGKAVVAVWVLLWCSCLGGEVWGISENIKYLYDFLLQYLKGDGHLVIGTVF